MAENERTPSDLEVMFQSDKVGIIGAATTAAAAAFSRLPTEEEVTAFATLIVRLSGPMSPVAAQLTGDFAAAARVDKQRTVTGTLLGIDFQTNSKRMVLVIKPDKESKFKQPHEGQEVFTTSRWDDRSPAEFLAVRDAVLSLGNDLFGQKISMIAANEPPKNPGEKGYKFVPAVTLGGKDPNYNPNDRQYQFQHVLASHTQGRNMLSQQQDNVRNQWMSDNYWVTAAGVPAGMSYPQFAAAQPQG